MIRIAICDDEKLFRDYEKKCIEKYLEEKGITYEIDTFNSGKEILQMGIEIIQYHIIFLDINMDEIDGIVTAQEIRKYSPDVYVVFVTAYIDYSLEGYKVGAMRYLLKNNINFKESMIECLDTIIHRMNFVAWKKGFKFIEGERNVLIERLLYVESRLHRLEFHIMENQMNVYRMYGTLNDLEKEMKDHSFIRIHQSFLVNLKHIKNVLGYKVILSNNQELAIPKTRYRDIKNVFIRYKGEV